MAEFNVGFLIYQDLTHLDFTGPQHVLSRMPESKTCMVAKSLAPIVSDSSLSFVPTHTFEDCPKLDLICIPGGMGKCIVDTMRDEETLAFVRRQASVAKYVTSVCTGAFILGAAGLLKGRRATTHWAFVDLLALFGAFPRNERFVVDGNVITAGGVTSGIDFGLRVVADIAGDDVAKQIQLRMEYDPDPPFPSGHPRQAAPSTVDAVAPRFQITRDQINELVLQ